MDAFSATIGAAGGVLADPIYWFVLVIAVLIAGPIGLVPGIGSTTILAVALPFLVFNVDPLYGLVFVAALLSLNNTLDSVPAVLIGYPGPATQVTFLEGHQLARQGHAAHTLGAVYAVSAIGGVVGAVVLAFAIPLIRPLIVRFSYPEIAAMAILGIAMVAMLARGNILKGFGAATLGLIVASVGTSPLTGTPRFTGGELYLHNGFPLIPVVLGVFALPEMVDLAMRRQRISQAITDVSSRQVWAGAREGLRRWKVAIRQSLFGVVMGIIPGIGSAVIDWLAYAFGMALTKDKSEFGKGSLDGVLFAEAAQNSKEAGQAVPTLAFGIPGGAGWALALVALIAYNVNPGLAMLGQHADITIAIVLTIGIGNLMMTGLGLLITGHLAKLILLPSTFIAGMFIPIIFISAFQANFAWGDILVVAGAGSVGLAMKWFGWPRGPFLLAFILGPVVEANLWTALNLRADGAFIFLVRPFALGILILAAVFGAFLIWMLTKFEAAAPVAESAAPASPSAAAQFGSTSGGSSRGSGPTAEAGHAAAPSRFRLRVQWQWEYLFWIVLLAVVGGYIFTETLGYSGRTQFFPLWASISFLAFMAALVAQSLFRSINVSTAMDLGMSSGTDSSALKNLLPVLGWIALFFVMSGIIGFPFSIILFPLLFINARLDWKGMDRLWSLVPTGFAALIAFLLDTLLNVVWPSTYILNWLFG